MNAPPPDALASADPAPSRATHAARASAIALPFGAELGRRLASLRGARAMLAAALFGAASALALPPLHLIPILWVSLPALLVLVGARPTVRGAAWTGFWFGFGHHVVGLYWITEAILVEAARFWWLVPLAVPLLAAVLALFIAAPCALARCVRAGWPRVLVLAGTWVLADLARQFIATGFPWNAWGSVWTIPGTLGDVMIQPAAWVSVHGLTLATVLLAATPALGRRAVLGSIAALALWAGAGAWRLDTPTTPPPGVTAVLVQGNIPQGQKHDQTVRIATFETYLRLTREAVAPLGDRRAVVIWPETASPFLLASDPNARAAIIEATGGRPGLIGSVRFDDAERPRNSLMAITSVNPPVAIYDKWHLVPFGEYQPDWFPLPIQIVPGSGFARGPGPQSMHIEGLPVVGALICYEAIFPGFVVDEKDRPDWLVNVTNDAWFGNSTGPRQHLAAVRLRSVEEGLPLMRAANTGISAGFNAFGHELNRIGMNVEGTLLVEIPGRLAPTLVARYGLSIALWIAVMCAIAGVVASMVTSSRM